MYCYKSAIIKICEYNKMYAKNSPYYFYSSHTKIRLWIQKKISDYFITFFVIQIRIKEIELFN